MVRPMESTRLIDPNAPPPSSTTGNVYDIGNIESGPSTTYTIPAAVPKLVDVNSMKRNMSIAKGFMDVSLLMANASQLKHLIVIGNGNFSMSVYHLIITGVTLSIILQIATGVLLILKERFDINEADDQKSADLYNNITIAFVFVTLLINVFISSFGPSRPKETFSPVKGK